MTYGGQPIEALYSADNNQGFGTADNDTRFQGYDGYGTAIPYLRAVNDSAYATPTYYTNWGYRTKNYSMSDIDSLLDFVINDRGDFGSFSDYVSVVKSTIGNVSTISFERDASNRVKKVWLKGPNGNSAVIGGWWFKYMWIIWVDANNITKEDGVKDFIYSQTYFIHVQ